MPPIIETARLLLAIPPPGASPRYARFAVENEEHLGPWEPPRPPGYFSEAYWARRIERNHDEHARDLSLRLGVFAKDDPGGPLLGHVNFNQIVRGGFQACILGYSLDHRVVGKGMMSEALAGAIPFVFDKLGLHRVMANYIPTNERSGRVLRRLGFLVEGYARDYLFIGGAWRDHILTSLTNPKPFAPSSGEVKPSQPMSR